mmetsp:Transcript_6069/g.16539  ORF Transcript_6069/g.16539 Transcript_6069/m.16539 type:complete len:143 (+) Transcript_6069:104-532(+)
MPFLKSFRACWLVVLLTIFDGALCATLSTGVDVDQFVQAKIADHEVMVFAKSYCPYCRRAKHLLKEMQQTIDVEVEYMNLDTLQGNDGPLIQKSLLDLTGQRTVPNIFIGHEHVGGNSEIQQLNAADRLETMLLEASNTEEL